jgi:hypothetical protein
VVNGPATLAVTSTTRIPFSEPVTAVSSFLFADASRQ